MLNSNPESNLTLNVNETMSANRDRFDDLMSTITEARRSLQNWQDQKTEALIKLDALSYDIQKIGEEKEKAKENAVQIRRDMENEVRVYQNHVDNLSDQIQMLQVEREGLQNQLNQALLENQVNYKEMTRLMASEQRLQDDLKNGIGRMQLETEARLRAEYEEQYTSQIEQLKLQLQELNSQNQSIVQQRNDAEERASRNERELGGIRSHMMSVLRVADEGSHSASSEARKTEARKMGDARPAHIDSKMDSKKLRAVELESGTVDEYLKRLGY